MWIIKGATRSLDYGLYRESPSQTVYLRLAALAPNTLNIQKFLHDPVYLIPWEVFWCCSILGSCRTFSSNGMCAVEINGLKD